MIILTTAIGYTAGDVSIFWDSLIATGYSGKLAVVGDCQALKDRGAIMIPDPDNGYPPMSRRWLAYSKFLKDVKEPVVITDCRDVIFQWNPEKFMPTKGVNVFEEDSSMSIGDCWYNSNWMKELGSDWDKKRIICCGVVSGELVKFSADMWSAISSLDIPLNDLTLYGIDQAVCNDLIYSGYPATIHENEKSEVYTVGYYGFKGEHVDVNADDFILNRNGDIPCMVHMYDRHVNLTVAAIKRLNLKVKIKNKYGDHSLV